MEKEKPVVKSARKFGEILELDVDFNGWNYLIIYGRHINGGFFASPNWQISCEMGDPDSDFYNIENLMTIDRMGPKTATMIATVIKEYYLSDKHNK